MAKIQLKRKLVGTINIPDGLVDITDPCYDRDVWCRMNDVAVAPGTWNCYAYKGERIGWGNRVWIVQIVIADGPLDKIAEDKIHSGKSWRQIGTVGVDAGLAGFFNHKPDFDDKEWHDLCNMMFAEERKGDSVFTKRFGSGDGFWTESGEGDGCYSVHAIRENRKIIALEIRFL